MFVRQHMTLFNGWMRTQWPTNIPFINRRRFPARHLEKTEHSRDEVIGPFYWVHCWAWLYQKGQLQGNGEHDTKRWSERTGEHLITTLKDSNANDGIRTDPIESKSSQRYQIITTVAIQTMTPMDHGVTPQIVAKSGTTVTLTSVLVIISAFHEVS